MGKNDALVREYTPGSYSITGLTDNATTVSLCAGQKIHIKVDENTTLMNQLSEICIEVYLSDNTTEVTPSAIDLAYGTGVSYPSVSANPFRNGQYLRLTVPDASIFTKYDMVTLHDQTSLLTNDASETYSYQQEDFEVLGTDNGSNYIYVSRPMFNFNIATLKVVKWNNKDTEFSITGGRFKGDPTAGDIEAKNLNDRKIFMRIMGVKAPALYDMRASDPFFGFCQITHSLAFKADNIRSERSRNQSYQGTGGNDFRSLSYIFDMYGANNSTVSQIAAAMAPATSTRPIPRKTRHIILPIA